MGKDGRDCTRGDVPVRLGRPAARPHRVQPRARFAAGQRGRAGHGAHAAAQGPKSVFIGMTLFVGTSGWQYRHWRHVFYPDKRPQREWLPFFAERFQTVEVNNTFYNLPERSVFEHWRKQTPDDFVFALKMSRYLAHLKRLHDPIDPVRRFMERAQALGPKMGPVLLQLPPRFRVNLDLLDASLDVFDPSVRVAVEFRDESWFQPETQSVLERHRAALCLADSPRRNQPALRTAGWAF